VTGPIPKRPLADARARVAWDEAERRRGDAENRQDAAEDHLLDAEMAQFRAYARERFRLYVRSLRLPPVETGA